MKKVLLGTSAIALAGAFASQASAADWNVKVGGYMEEQVVFTSTDSASGTNYDGIDTISDGEVHFKPSITLDNGIKFGVQIELEGATTSDQIDENYAYVEGSFGRILIGEDDNVAYTMAYGAPDVTFYNINSGSDTLSLPFSADFGTTSTYPSVEGDSAGLHYFTPRMAGFQLGASYARDQNRSTVKSNQDKNADGKMFNIWAVGANYVNTIGDISIAASAGYTRGYKNGMPAVDEVEGIVAYEDGETPQITSYFCGDVLGGGDPVILREAVCPKDKVSDSTPTAYAFGLNIGFSGVTVGGSYANYDETSSDRYVYDVGASYETGPWGFSVTYLHSKIDASKDKIDKFLVGATYQLATGVKLGAFGAYENMNPNEGSSVSGFVLGSGFKLNF